MTDLISSPAFQWIASIIITALLSVYLAVRFSSNKKIMFEIGNVFHFTTKNLAEFSKLTMSIDGKNLLDGENNSEFILVEFTFENIGNKDIRFTKKDGQYLKFILDDSFQIIDTNDVAPVKLNEKKNSLNVNFKSLKIGDYVSVLAILKHSYETEPQDEDVIQGRLLWGTSFDHDIHDLKKISLEKNSHTIFEAVFLLGSFLFSLLLGIACALGEIENDVNRVGDILGGIAMIIFSFFILRFYFRERRIVRRFHQRQN